MVPRTAVDDLGRPSYYSRPRRRLQRRVFS